ncbi:MAG: polysaccharide biosynthesis C-terminal domain-containing protein [Lachnospiraceae bacterium]|nr:polysaccharide biosynthesis C-terminal domain-containing protein [Lachnospiraceae bacterium]
MKRRRKKKRQINIIQLEDDVIRLLNIFTVLCIMLTGVLVVRRCGLEGSAFYFGAMIIYILLLLIYPIPLSESLYEAVRRRKETENFRNSKRIFNFGVVSTVAYVLLAFIGIFFAGRLISEYMLAGKSNTLVLGILSANLLFDAVILLISDYDAAMKDMTHRSIVLFIRSAGSFVMVLLFSRYFYEKGKSVSRFLGNEAPGQAYLASGAALGMLISSIIAFAACFVLYLSVRESFEKMIRSDKSSRIEDGYMLLGNVWPYALSLLSFFMFDILIWPVYRGALVKSGQDMLFRYHMGIYHGVVMLLLLIPAALVYLFIQPKMDELKKAIKGEYLHEVNTECRQLTKTAMLIGFAFCGVFFALAPVICEGLYGCDSVLAVRALRFGVVILPFLIYSLVSSLYLVMIKRYMTLIMHTIISAVPSLILAFVLCSSGKVLLMGAMAAFMISQVLLALFNHMHLYKYMKFRFNLRDYLVVPLAGALLSMVLSFLLRLLFSLFLPPLICFVPAAFIGLFAYFILICIGGSVNKYKLKAITGGRLLYKIARKLRVL